MKALKEILEEQVTKMKESKFYRFRLYINENDMKKTVGMAYLKEGQNIYTLRLWMFLEDKIHLLPSKDDPAKYLLMTREETKSLKSKNKYFWNIVGNGNADSSQSAIQLRFDLFDKPILMNMFPEESSTPYGQPVPHAASSVA